MTHTKSEQIFVRAQRVIPGGVNSPVRAFSSAGVKPIIAKSAHGSRLTDADDNEFIDYIGSWGPLIFGHSPHFLTQRIREFAQRGTTFGLATETETEMAELLCSAYPGMEMVRMVNSGTEAAMSAIRVARGVTGREKIIKFAGCYHGHSDALLVQSGSGALTFGTPDSPGVPEAAAGSTLVCRYNDLASVKAAFSDCGGEIACVIIEPVAGNMGLIRGEESFLAGLRRICSENGSILIFDEVISGFRLAYGGAAEYYGITPDMVCLGKIIGGGMPVGAYGGKREIMQHVSPSGPIYQAGTLSGNPLALSLGMSVLKKLRDTPSVYTRLEEAGALLESGIRDNIRALRAPCTVSRCGSLLTLFFTERPQVESYEDVKSCNTRLYAAYCRQMLRRGILLPPSQYECMFLSTAHSRGDIRATVAANYEALKEVI